MDLRDIVVNEKGSYEKVPSCKNPFIKQPQKNKRVKTLNSLVVAGAKGGEGRGL